MNEVVPAEQIEAFRTNGIGRVDDLLTGDELDTFEPLLTAAVAYPLGRRRAHARGTLAVPAVVRQADVAKAGQSSSADNKPVEFVCDLLLAASEIPQVDNEVPDHPLQWISILILTRDRLAQPRDRSVVLVAAWAAA